jgi:predicted nucleotidyltransferase component of viral defense system
MMFNNPQWEALTENTRSAFFLLQEPAYIHRYYLAGGTGLALHLGHRFSVDLDFFSEHPDALSAEERSAIRQTLNDPTLEISQDTEGTFTCIWNGVGISFFRLDHYPIVLPMPQLNGIRIASVEEIGAMKLAAILGRGTRKDFVDLYFILQHVSLEDLFKIAAVKYARVKSFAMNTARAMAYFEDAEALPMPHMIDPTPWTQMKRLIAQQAARLGHLHLDEFWDE